MTLKSQVEYNNALAERTRQIADDELIIETLIKARETRALLMFLRVIKPQTTILPIQSVNKPMR